MGNDPEIKFQGIKSLIFQEVERTLRRLPVSFFIRSKVYINFSIFFMTLKVSKALFSAFDLMIVHVANNFFQEIKSLTNVYKLSISWSNLLKVFFNFCSLEIFLTQF
jgi:hypothetical protein